MDGEKAAELSKMLASAAGGDRAAIDHLYAVLYPELRALAHQRLRGSQNAVRGADLRKKPIQILSGLDNRGVEGSRVCPANNYASARVRTRTAVFESDGQARFRSM
jgi:hypothetical protein